MIKILRFSFVAICVSILSGCQTTASRTPGADDVVTALEWSPATYACGRAESPIVIDGRLDEIAWQRAEWSAAFRDIQGAKRPQPRFSTRAKMVWDDRYFYVAAELEEPHLWATITQRDAVIFHENDFEVFIDPDGDTQLYAELELNALNTIWDLLLVRTYDDGGPAIDMWDIAGLQTAVHLRGTLNDPRDRDDAWTIEIAIPFAALEELTDRPAPPAAGDRWRVNFSRVQYQLTPTTDGYEKKVDAATGKPLAEDNWTWSPQRVIAIHEPEYWGFVEFRTAGDTNRSVEITDEDRARFVMKRFGNLARDTGIRKAKRMRRPVLLAASWSWPPTIQSGTGWFRATIRDHAGREIWVDQTGAIGHNRQTKK